MAWLAERVLDDRPLVLHGAFDALSARMIEHAGAEAIYCSGFATCAAAFGLPDLGVVTATEMAEHFRRIRAVTTLPMIVDADTGYGEALNVERTIRNLAAVGVAACHIEDQAFPKRCGHMSGKRVVERSDALARMRIAVETGRASDIDIIGRTDALATHGVEEAIERANRFLDLGAVAAFVDAPRCDDDLRTIAAGVRGPLIFNTPPAGWATAGVEPPAAYRIHLRPLQLLLTSFEAVQLQLDACFVAPPSPSEVIDRLQQTLSA